MRVLIHSVVVCLLVLCASATARVAGLSVTGTITDSAGAALPGVTVELVSNATVVATVTTDAHGAFEFKNVTPRRYELRARLNGFKELRTRVVVAGTSSPAPLRLVMQPGRTGETVTVDAKSTGFPGSIAGGVAGGVPAAASPAAPSAADEARMRWGAMARYAASPAGPFNTEAYDRIEDNSFRRVTDAPLSTFSIDVDTASYANVRRFLNQGTLPPADAVRVEELINYFHFDYPDSSERAPFGITTEVGAQRTSRRSC